jgi:hypothetical protein
MRGTIEGFGGAAGGRGGVEASEPCAEGERA